MKQNTEKQIWCEMERLTNSDKEIPTLIDNAEYWLKLYFKLKDFEDAEEQGLLLKLPCKVGDTVWVVTSPFNVFDDIEYEKNMRNEVYEAFVSSVTFYKNGEQYRISAKVTNHFIGAYFQKCDFGKTVFLTKEEAEAKLKEMI
nr:MAG TPA: hypothetical protein [Caudoviricetes sp.]